MIGRETARELIDFGGRWDSVAVDPASVPLTREQRVEVLRRLEEHERSPTDVVGWDEAEARIRGQLEK
jgi:putative addiction module component (TIGR02574 family)